MQPPTGEIRTRRSSASACHRLVALCFLWGIAAAGAQTSDPVVWEGRFEMGDATVLLEIEVNEPGEASAWLTGIDGRRRPTPIEAFELGPDGVSFRLPEIERGYAFDGRLVSPSRIEGELERMPPPVPSTDLYRAPIEAREGWPGWSVGAPVNLTDRPGYDNQPSFLPDGSSLLYTSMRDGQTDIYRYDLASGAIRGLTATPESEYSPTPLPDGGGFSVVRVESDGTQRLWAFDSDGSNPRLLLPDVEPVGYHAWLDEAAVALFVLGEPPTLEIADLSSGETKTVARNIGRGLAPSSDDRSVLYVAKSSTEGGSWEFGVAGLEDEPDRPVVWSLRPRPGREDFLLLQDRALPGAADVLQADGSRLFVGVETGDGIGTSPAGHPGSGWREVADLSAHGIDDITRLALSPDGSTLVFVAERPDLSSFPERLGLTLVLAGPDG